MKKTLSRTSVYALLLAVAIFAVAQSPQAQNKSDRNTWTWNNSDDGKKSEVRVENKVEFNDDGLNTIADAYKSDSTAPISEQPRISARRRT